MWYNLLVYLTIVLISYPINHEDELRLDKIVAKEQPKICFGCDLSTHLFILVLGGLLSLGGLITMAFEE